MRNLIIIMLTVSFGMVACKNSNNSSEADSVTKDDSVQAIASESDETTSSSIDPLIEGYLQIKNALANDDDKKAASNGQALANAFEHFDKSLIPASQLNEYEDLEADMKEHAEHIGHNAGNIEHQREHFVLLSNDMVDFVKTFGTTQKLFKYFCSMANENKGALWLSETKEIGNPYLGSKMESCGEFQGEIPLK